MLIGEVSSRTGLPTSTLRYYERIGLVRPPARVSGQRRYTEDVFARLTVIEFATASGFTLAEVKQLFLGERPYSTRLRTLAKTKLAEIDDRIRRAESMKKLLHTALRCRCLDVETCSRQIRATLGLRR